MPPRYVFLAAECIACRTQALHTSLLPPSSMPGGRPCGTPARRAASMRVRPPHLVPRRSRGHLVGSDELGRDCIPVELPHVQRLARLRRARQLGETDETCALKRSLARDFDVRDGARALALLLDVVEHILVLVVRQHAVRDEPLEAQTGGRRRRGLGGRLRESGEARQERRGRLLARRDVAPRPADVECAAAQLRLVEESERDRGDGLVAELDEGKLAVCGEVAVGHRRAEALVEARHRSERRGEEVLEGLWRHHPDRQVTHVQLALLAPNWRRLRAKELRQPLRRVWRGGGGRVGGEHPRDGRGRRRVG
mmetsp:Transcript_17557/g.44157  ORF Transcript_17557/g.44157 Transcript_17557/m.44157 type:complete len:310 (+) Transcript_17557:415-1344(+)